MLLKHFFVEKIAHSSYLLAGKHTAAVFDPRRDIDIYLEEANHLGVRITHILQTHMHADFISGHLDLAKMTGAPIYTSAASQAKYAHIPLREGNVIDLEDMRLEVLETPGHSPDHLVYIVKDLSRADAPLGVFTGDLLFVGDVGRPDLFPNQAEELADKLYHTLHDKLMQLPDYVEVYPAHGAGSLCGRSMGSKYRTTIGYEKRFNPALQIKDKASFIHSLTSDMPPAPDHFARCHQINREGPTLMNTLPVMQDLPPEVFASLVEEGIKVVDVRSYLAFAASHIPGAWHIDISGNYPTYAGWVLDPDEVVLIVADNRQQAEQAQLGFQRVGIDKVDGTLLGGMAAWITEGFGTESLGIISPEEFHALISSGNKLQILDVRTTEEFNESNFSDSVNILSPDLRRQSTGFDPEKPVYVFCSSGIRSGLGASILSSQGFRKVFNLQGGLDAYLASGYQP